MDWYMTHSYVCDMTHSYVCDMTHPYVCDITHTYVEQLIWMRDGLTHSYGERDLFLICVTYVYV